MKHPAYCYRIDSKVSKKLFAEICKTLKREKLYRNPNFTASELSELLHINTRNIAAVVQLNTGNNFSNLLNTYRLADAEFLLRNKQEFSAEEIGLMSGFGSRQSFYRVFQQFYGTTPRKFRLSHLEQQAQQA